MAKFEMQNENENENGEKEWTIGMLLKSANHL